MQKFYILLGSNLGDREAYLREAIRCITQIAGRISIQSSVYETAPWGYTDQPAFLNQVIVAESVLQPEAMLRKLLNIERDMGRVRDKKWGSRIIDLDILMVDELEYNAPGLTIPHPELPERRFALLPLADVAPELLHPVKKKTIAELLNECKDRLAVHKYMKQTDTK